MNWSDEIVIKFKTQLQQSILVCSERCLYQSAKWAAELLEGIKPEMLDNMSLFTQSESHLNVISPYNTPYESTLPPLSEYEYNKYQYAKILFQMRQYGSVQDVLGDSKSPKLYFLRLYAKYMNGEKKKEELTQEIMGGTEDLKAENLELESIYIELDEDYKNDKLDAFGLYLYGIVLKKRKLKSRAALILIESLRKYQFNWSAWMELASLVHNAKMLFDLERLLDREFGASLMKNLFLGKLYIDLHQPIGNFKSIMDPINKYFSKSPYIIVQWALLFNERLDINESLVLFEELRKMYPSRLDKVDILSNVLYLGDAKEKLCILALECDKIDKYRPETCVVRGNYYSIKLDHALAVECYKRALKLNRSYHLAWTLLGHEYVELKETYAAVECYRRAVSYNSRDFRAWYGLGKVHELMKFPSDALYYYQQAADLQPHDSRMWLALSSCYKALRQDEQSRFCDMRATACENDVGTAEYQLGKIYENMDEIDKACDYYHSFWEQARQDNVISEELAETSLYLASRALEGNMYEEAEKYAYTALNTRHPYHERARSLLDEIQKRSIGS